MDILPSTYLVPRYVRLRIIYTLYDRSVYLKNTHFIQRIIYPLWNKFMIATLNHLTFGAPSLSLIIDNA